MALPLVACIPSPPPPSLLSDEPEIIGMSMELVEPGPLSVDLLPIPADRVQSEALPGDRVRVTALAARRDGQLDLDALGARWLLTRTLQLSNLELSPCDPSDPLGTVESCDAGVGASVEFLVPGIAADRDIYQQNVYTLVVVGLEVSTDECVDRIRAGPERFSWDCMIGLRSVDLGPVPRLVAAMQQQGIPLDPQGELELPELPDLPELPELVPNFAPRTPWITLSRFGEVRRVWPGERVQLPAGARFDLLAVEEGRDSQDYVLLGYDGELLRGIENISRAWHATEPVVEFEVLAVPDDEVSFTIFVVTTDSRSSQTWVHFDFDVVPP